MAKIELKGVIKSVSPVTLVGTNGTKKQSVILFIPGWRDEFEEKRGQDEVWSLDIIGEKVDKLNLSDSTATNQKAACTVYVSSREFTKEEKTMYFIGANLAEIKLMGAATAQPVPAQMPVATGNTDDDDLPF